MTRSATASVVSGAEKTWILVSPPAARKVPRVAVLTSHCDEQ
jgi:hypothetical protein